MSTIHGFFKDAMVEQLVNEKHENSLYNLRRTRTQQREWLSALDDTIREIEQSQKRFEDSGALKWYHPIKVQTKPTQLCGDLKINPRYQVKPKEEATLVDRKSIRLLNQYMRDEPHRLIHTAPIPESLSKSYPVRETLNDSMRCNQALRSSIQPNVRIKPESASKIADDKHVMQRIRMSSDLRIKEKLKDTLHCEIHTTIPARGESWLSSSALSDTKAKLNILEQPANSIPFSRVPPRKQVSYTQTNITQELQIQNNATQTELSQDRTMNLDEIALQHQINDTNIHRETLPECNIQHGLVEPMRNIDTSINQEIEFHDNQRKDVFQVLRQSQNGLNTQNNAGSSAQKIEYFDNTESLKSKFMQQSQNGMDTPNDALTNSQKIGHKSQEKLDVVDIQNIPQTNSLPRQHDFKKGSQKSIPNNSNIQHTSLHGNPSKSTDFPKSREDQSVGSVTQYNISNLKPNLVNPASSFSIGESIRNSPSILPEEMTDMQLFETQNQHLETQNQHLETENVVNQLTNTNLWEKEMDQIDSPNLNRKKGTASKCLATPSLNPINHSPQESLVEKPILVDSDISDSELLDRANDILAEAMRTLEGSPEVQQTTQPYLLEKDYVVPTDEPLAGSTFDIGTTAIHVSPSGSMEITVDGRDVQYYFSENDSVEDDETTPVDSTPKHRKENANSEDALPVSNNTQDDRSMMLDAPHHSTIVSEANWVASKTMLPLNALDELELQVEQQHQKLVELGIL